MLRFVSQALLSHPRFVLWALLSHPCFVLWALSLHPHFVSQVLLFMAAVGVVLQPHLLRGCGGCRCAAFCVRGAVVTPAFCVVGAIVA